MTKVLIIFILLLGLACGNPTTTHHEKNEIVETEIDSILESFLVTPVSIGPFKKGMTISEVLQIIPKEQIVKTIGHGEFIEDTYDDYEIYSSKKEHLLTLTPKVNIDVNSTIHRVLVIDHRYKTQPGIGLNSTYAEIKKAYTVSNYIPDKEHIVLSIDQLGASFSIKKTDLQQDWWNAEKKKINIIKIPPGSIPDSFVIWWN